MSRASATFFLIILVLLGISSAVINHRIGLQIKAQNQQLQNQRLDIATLKLQSLFNGMKYQLAQQQRQYSLLHTEIQGLLNANPRADIKSIKAQFSEQLGYEIDIYRISSDFIITNSTFTPDIGIDFKAPYFEDALAMLQEAKNTQSVVIGQPTMEIVSLKHKIYSISPLVDGSFLEIGFIDPKLSNIFSSAQEFVINEPELLSVDFYNENNGVSVSPLTQLMNFVPKVSKYQSKSAYIEEVGHYLTQEHSHFKDLTIGNFNKVARAGIPDEHFYYFVLDEQQVTSDFSYRTIGKLHVKNDEVNWTDTYSTFAATIILIAIIIVMFTVIIFNVKLIRQSTQDSSKK